MEARIRFMVKDEEEYNNILEGSILPGEIWELYDSDDGELIRKDDYSELHSKAKTEDKKK